MSSDDLLIDELRLFEELCRIEGLRAGFNRVRKNKGSPGIDGVTIAEFESRLDEELSQLQQELESWTYKPSPVRRVEIPKPGGKGLRLLGVPTVRDRVVQATLKRLLEPIFEPLFSAHSYGFIRPVPGAHPAGQLKLFKIVPDDFVALGEANARRWRRRARLSPAARPMWWISIWRNFSTESTMIG